MEWKSGQACDGNKYVGKIWERIYINGKIAAHAGMPEIVAQDHWKRLRVTRVHNAALQ